MGDPLNIAAHLAAKAATGEVLLTKKAAEAGRLRTESLSERHLLLKGSEVVGDSLSRGLKKIRRLQGR